MLVLELDAFFGFLVDLSFRLEDFNCLFRLDFFDDRFTEDSLLLLGAAAEGEDAFLLSGESDSRFSTVRRTLLVERLPCLAPKNSTDCDQLRERDRVPSELLDVDLCDRSEETLRRFFFLGRGDGEREL